MLCRADSVGVFQVVAQMATPRLKPRTFFDLVVEGRPHPSGLIQGGSVHPYIRRLAAGGGPLRPSGPGALVGTHPGHPAVPGAVDADGRRRRRVQCRAGRPTAPSDGLKRSPEKMARYGRASSTACVIFTASLVRWRSASTRRWPPSPISASRPFARLRVAGVLAWFKLHHPAAFCAALLRAQPMGFYSPQSLVADARADTAWWCTGRPERLAGHATLGGEAPIL